MSDNHSFWKYSRWIFVTAVFFIAIIIGITALYNINIEYSLYFIGFFVIFFAVVLVLQYRNYKYSRKLYDDYYAVNEEQRKKFRRFREDEDFFALWAHQIKTPIAALNVLLQENEVSVIACRQELVKIEGYVEMALGYTRYENMGNDLVLEHCSLESIIKGVVKKYSTIFIYKHIAINLDNLKYKILTDEKWFAFVLEQILSNALKYTLKGEISITAKETEDGLAVCVADTGIGIREEDIPRIFEKGFTGYNGRMDKKASGLGLYLCRGVCDKLGHKLLVTSKINEGTEVTVLLQYDKIKQSELSKI